MTRVLSANLRRLSINALFYICAAVVFFGTLLLTANGSLLFFGSDVSAETLINLAAIFPAGLNTIFISFFIGRDYSDKTIRNKITVGHSKNEIYAAYFITIAISTLIWILLWLSGGVIGAVISGKEIETASLLLDGAVVLLYNLSFASVLTAFCMITPSRALSVVIHTQIPPIIMTFVMVNGSNLEIAKEFTAKEHIMKFFINAVPMGQWFFNSVVTDTVLYDKGVLILLSAAVTALFSAAGVLLFRAKELK